MRIFSRLLLAIGLAAAPAIAHATPITYTYDFTLNATSSNNSTLIGGTGSFTTDTPLLLTGYTVNHQYTYVQGADLTGLTFTIDGQTFTLAGNTATPGNIVIENGQIYSIKFTDVSRPYELTTSGQYTFYYGSNFGSAAYGNFTNLTLYVPPPTTPEPSSFILLGTALCALGALVYRRRAPATQAA